MEADARSSPSGLYARHITAALPRRRRHRSSPTGARARLGALPRARAFSPWREQRGVSLVSVQGVCERERAGGRGLVAAEDAALLAGGGVPDAHGGVVRARGEQR